MPYEPRKLKTARTKLQGLQNTLELYLNNPQFRLLIPVQQQVIAKQQAKIQQLEQALDFPRDRPEVPGDSC